MFEVILSPEAQAFFSASDGPLARKLARCFAQLEREPRRHNNIKRLSGKLAGRLRYRVGVPTVHRMRNGESSQVRRFPGLLAVNRQLASAGWF